MLLHRMALVFSTVLLKFGQRARIVWANGLPPPLAKNCPTAYAYVSNQLYFRKNPKGRELFQRPRGQITKDLSYR